MPAGQDEITSIYQIYCVFSLLFSQKISTKQFLAPKVPVLRRNKATNSSIVLQPIHFQLERKPLYQVSYSSLKDLPSRLHEGFLPLGIMKRIRRLSYFFIFIPKWQTPRANVMSSLKTLNKLPSTWALICLQNGNLRC